MDNNDSWTSTFISFDSIKNTYKGYLEKIKENRILTTYCEKGSDQTQLIYAVKIDVVVDILKSLPLWNDLIPEEDTDKLCEDKKTYKTSIKKVSIVIDCPDGTTIFPTMKITNPELLDKETIASRFVDWFNEECENYGLGTLVLDTTGYYDDGDDIFVLLIKDNKAIQRNYISIHD